MHVRGQYALEQMGVIALALVIIAAVFFFSMNSTNDDARMAQAKDTVEKIARAADNAYSFGPGSKSTVSIIMPQSVQFVNTSGKQVWIRVALSSGNTDVFAKTNGQIVGTILTTAGSQELTFTTLSDGNISVGRQIVSCSPSSFTKTIVQGSSTDANLTVFNTWAYAVSGISTSLSGVSDMASAGTPPGSISSGSSANILLSFNVSGAKPAGTYSGSISVNASNGSACTSAITIFVTSSTPQDSLGPTVSGLISTPSAGITAATPITITATAIDAASPVSACLLELNNSMGAWNRMTPGDGAFNGLTEAIEYYVSPLPEGNYTAKVYCTDSLGNAGAQASYSFSVSAAGGAPPAFAFTSRGSPVSTEYFSVAGSKNENRRPGVRV